MSYILTLCVQRTHSAMAAPPRYTAVLCSIAASLLPRASTISFFYQISSFESFFHRPMYNGASELCKLHTDASYPANLAPPWKKYPTAVGPNPVKRPLVPSDATIFRPADRSESRASAGSIWIRVLTTSMAICQSSSFAYGQAVCRVKGCDRRKKKQRTLVVALNWMTYVSYHHETYASALSYSHQDW